ncbi:dipeptidase [Streptosporangium sp. CA-135522]|uniref:dipeptidase n=1 Tax=Streptosporangium sp. CA-135522 TaxID=3240072 RepID=UPI003D8BB633
MAHWGRTALADGSGEDATGSRLTAAGVEAVREMERLGMIFDVSHLGASGVEHVLELATRPVMATHSSARALRDHHRNLTDDQIRAIAATGGVVCVNFLAAFLSADPAEYTVDRLVDHIEHIVSVGGIDHVGLGPDFVHEVLTELTPPCCEDLGYGGEIDPLAYLPGLDGPRGLPLVTEALVGRGVPENDIVKILGDNVLRLFRAELGRPR